MSSCFIQGKAPFIHVGNHVVSELGPIVQFAKAKVRQIEPVSFLFDCNSMHFINLWSCEWIECLNVFEILN